MENIEKILNESQPISHAEDTPVTKYLRSRGLDPSKCDLSEIRFHKSLPLREKGGSSVSLPAMLTICRDVRGRIVCLQVLYLTQGGAKYSDSPRRFIGKQKAAKVILGQVGEVVGVAEGVETALAVHQATGLTVYSALNASNLNSATFPKQVKVVHVFADTDISETGQKNARELCYRLVSEGLAVFLHEPPFDIPPGSKGIDWADVLKNHGEEVIRTSTAAVVPFEPEFESELVQLSSVEPTQVDWLWEPYLPKGKITILEGDPGLGKSFITLGLAAAVSTGGEVGGTGIISTVPELDLTYKLGVGTVLLYCSEDGLADTIRPRLDAMDADLTRIFGYDFPIQLDEEGKAKIRSEFMKHKPSLAIFDPIQAFIKEGTDIHRANDVRQFMGWLANLASQVGCVVLLVRHVVKGGVTQAIYKGLGSIDFTAAARSVLHVGANQQDKDDRAIFHIKSNLAPLGDAIGYSIKDGGLEWCGKSSLSFEKIYSSMTSVGNGDAEKQSALEAAEEFLREELKMGAIPSTDLLEKAKVNGISKRTLDRAKKNVGVKPVKEQVDGKTVWFVDLKQRI